MPKTPEISLFPDEWRTRKQVSVRDVNVWDVYALS